MCVNLFIIAYLVASVFLVTELSAKLLAEIFPFVSQMYALICQT